MFTVAPPRAIFAFYQLFSSYSAGPTCCSSQGFFFLLLLFLSRRVGGISSWQTPIKLFSPALSPICRLSIPRHPPRCRFSTARFVDKLKVCHSKSSARQVYAVVQTHDLLLRPSKKIRKKYTKSRSFTSCRY